MLFALGRTTVSFAAMLQTLLFLDECAVTRFLNCLTELEEIDQAKKDWDDIKDTPKLASMTAWPTWVKLFTTYLSQHRSIVTGTQLADVIHDNDEVAPHDLA